MRKLLMVLCPLALILALPAPPASGQANACDTDPRCKVTSQPPRLGGGCPAAPPAAAACSCSGGVDAWGNPIDPEMAVCGASFCGRSGLMTCTSSGWRVAARSACGHPSGPRDLIVDDLADGQRGNGSWSNPFRRLQDALDEARDGDRVFLQPGTYQATATPTVDPTCGNCNNEGPWPFRQRIPVTQGFHVTGKSVSIFGLTLVPSQVRLVTNAGYGFYFNNAGSSRVRNVTITGGLRNCWPEASDGAVVARYTDLTLENVHIEENTSERFYDPTPTCPVDCGDSFQMGITGIVVREGANVTVRDSLVRRNSWDGIALYRSDPAVGKPAHALIEENELADGANTGHRSGAIGLTYDASAVILNNYIHHYVKGILIFSEASAFVANNVVHNIDAWAMTPQGGYSIVRNNVFYGPGLKGMWVGGTGYIANNVVSGFNEGLDLSAPGVTFEYNDFWNNASNNGPSGGTGNLTVDPRFVDPANHDFHLACASPLRNAGIPTCQDSDGTRCDMGAYSGPYLGAIPVAPPSTAPACGGGSGALDLIFLVDTTGSMWDDIDQTKVAGAEIVAALEDSGADFRVAVASYRDFPVSPYGGAGDYPYAAIQDFSADPATIIAGIQSLGLGWGNDWPESVYSGLLGSICTDDLSPWRPEAVKIVLAMGDAPPHVPEPFTGYVEDDVVTAAQSGGTGGVCAAGLRALSEISEIPGVRIYAVSIGPDTETYLAFLNLASRTSGKVFRAATARDVAQAILEALGDITGESNRPPTCESAYASPSSLWPPNHALQSVAIRNVEDPDGDPVTLQITAITQDEPVSGRGSGNTSPDATGIGTATAQVRAERAGADRSRVYQISFTADDGHGGQCTGSVRVCVPHDQEANTACDDDGQLFDSTLN